MTESSRDDRLSESARVVKARKERICEVAPEHWEKAQAETPTGTPVTERGAGKRTLSVHHRGHLLVLKIGGTAFIRPIILLL